LLDAALGSKLERRILGISSFSDAVIWTGIGFTGCHHLKTDKSSVWSIATEKGRSILCNRVPVSASVNDHRHSAPEQVAHSRRQLSSLQHPFLPETRWKRSRNPIRPTRQKPFCPICRWMIHHSADSRTISSSTGRISGHPYPRGNSPSCRGKVSR
jgi:hypothetical protein